MPDSGSMVQIHLLTSYPAALLNRDDAGLAKRIPFGGATRTRISSQCLKKHWREATQLDAGETLAVRSRIIFEKFVAGPLRASDAGLTEAEIAVVAKVLVDAVLASKKGEGGDDAGEDDGDAEAADAGGRDATTEAGSVKQKQVIVLSAPECDWLTETAKEMVRLARERGVAFSDEAALKAALGAGKGPKAAKPKKGKKGEAVPAADDALVAFWRDRLEIIRALAASVDVALFGRFITSDLLTRVDAAVSVAHAFTTHTELAETDYFTAMDMLDDSSAGAGHLNDTELTSGVFYTYVVVDFAQLRSNLGPHADQAESLIARFVRTMATVGPRAKRGSTAPFALAEFVLLERGDEQPRTLANAFRKPVARDEGGDLMAASIRALMDHRERLDAMFEASPRAALSTIHGAEIADGIPCMSLSAAIAQIIGPRRIGSDT